MKTIQRFVAALVAVVMAAAIAPAAELATRGGAGAGPKVFIAPMNGFENYISAAIAKKGVPVHIVADREQADYVLEGASESQKAGWAKILIQRDVRSTEEASVRLIDVKTSEVVFAYQYHMGSSWFGKQSASESCAKHLGAWLRGGK